MPVSADMVRKLAELGLSPDQIAGVAGLIESEEEARRAAKRDGNRARQARLRASRDVTRDTPPVTRDPPAPLKERSPPAPPLKKITPHPPPSSDDDGERNAGARTKRGTRVDGFEPDIDAAIDLGLPAERARNEAARFVDFWRGKAGKDGVKLDWPATWRNWVRGAIERRSTSPPAGRRGQTIDQSRNQTRGRHDVEGDPDDSEGGGMFAEAAERRRRQFAEHRARSESAET